MPTTVGVAGVVQQGLGEGDDVMESSTERAISGAMAVLVGRLLRDMLISTTSMTASPRGEWGDVDVDANQHSLWSRQ
jgi:hypothetical protein